MESTVNSNSTPEPSKGNQIDFSNTEIAFSNKSNLELKKMARLFNLMANPLLTNVGSKLGLLSIKLRLPFVKSIVKATIFKQFCGGENLLDCQEAIDKLYKYNTLTVLDYGAEGKTSEEELNEVVAEFERAIELAASNNSVPVITIKVTGLADNGLLMKVQNGDELSANDKVLYDRLIQRVETVCSKASDLKVGVFIDAEESWLQDAIDDVVTMMMEKYNKDSVTVYNTYQLYRHDKLAQLKADHKKGEQEGYLIGAKLVRGAYMEKERERASEMGYKSPIQPNKKATDKDFDAAVKFCLHNYKSIASCCASHNIASNKKQADLIDKLGIQKDHPHINFCQLYGMSDYITFNIANAGYNVAKYVPYGPIKEVVPYLIRRAQENTSVTGEMTRELNYINLEKKRRKI